MPPLILFNKEWRVGTDDFVYSSIIEVLVRGGWTLGLSFILGFHVQEAGSLKCLGKEYQYTTAYLITAFIFQIITSVNLVQLSFYSSRGKIFDKSYPHPRRLVSPLIYVNILLTVIEFALTCVGTFFAIKDLLRCMDEARERIVIIIILVIIAATYVLLLTKMAIALTAIKPFSRPKAPEETRHLLAIQNHSREIQRRESELTYRGLRCLMPCTNDESTVQAFQEISNLLSKIFHDSDLVPSDILAGLLILHYKHSIRTEVPDLAPAPVVTQNLEQNSCKKDLAELKYFFKYSVAAYGCWWYLIDSPCGHVCSLAAHLSYCPCFPCMAPQSGLVEGDGCCLCNLAAAKAMLNVSTDDFVIFDNRNRIQEVPYYMTVDPLQKTLVISIRGTLSIHDMFTDLRGEAGALSEGIMEIEMREDFRAHKGMVAAARYLYRRLHGLPVSEREADDQERRENILALTLAHFDDHKVVVTGHSLGAGTAVILTFLLRAKYPDRDIRCLAYSPPGGLLSPAAAEESDKFTLSLVAGDDVIPRTSLPNIGRLSSDIRKMCERCEIPKYKLFGHGLVALCCCFKSSLIREEVSRMSMEEDGNTRRQLSIKEFGSPMTAAAPDTPASDTSSHMLLSEPDVEPVCVEGASAPLSAAQSEPMYLPGRIVYIEEQDGMCSSSYRPKHSFSSIIVSPRMIADHLPNFITHLLEKT